MILFEHILKNNFGDLQVEEIFRPFDICSPPEPIKA